MLGLHFCARAFSSCSEWGPLFITVHGPLTITASLVVEHRLQTHRISSCGSWAQLLRGMWDLPRPGLEPMSPALAGRFSTTVPPGKPSLVVFSGVYCSFVWNQFLCFLILLNFPCLCEIRWNSYFFQFWMGILVLEHPFAVYMCPMALVGVLELKWPQVTYSLRVCSQLSHWWEMWLEIGGVRVRARCETGLLLCSVFVTAFSGVGLCPKVLKQRPWGSGPICFHSL